MFDELTMHLGGPQYLGVFTKKAVWTERFCDLKKWAHIKLWYSNANEKPTFGDYLRFGGWIDPYAK